jgi:diacylglycerol O-acyltransferase
MARAESRPPLDLPRRMTASDALFWYGEAALPTLRPIIAGLYLLDRGPDRERLRRGIEAAIAMVPRLHQRVVEVPFSLGLPEWVDDAHFDLAYHLRHVSLPEPRSLRHLLELVAKLIATPLDRERPLWESYWVEGLEDGRAAYLIKMHHSVVDGVGSLALLAALTQAGRDDAPVRVRKPRKQGDGSGGGALQRLAALASDQARTSATLVQGGLRSAGRALADPRAALDDLARTARGFRGLAQDLLSPMIRDPLASSGAGISRRLDVFDVPLERLRKMKAPLGCSINDVVLTVLAGALGGYHRERRVHLDGLNCMVPMNLRSRGESMGMGNRVGTFNVVLPVGERQPARRLATIVEQTRAAKQDQRGAAFPLLAEFLPLVPTPALRWIARRSLGKVNVACTNIPGVPQRRYMAGAEIQAMYPFASPVEGTPVVVALLSYAGAMHVGIDTDPEAVPDPHRLTELFEKELDAVERLAESLRAD